MPTHLNSGHSAAAPFSEIRFRAVCVCACVCVCVCALPRCLFVLFLRCARVRVS